MTDTNAAAVIWRGLREAKVPMAELDRDRVPARPGLLVLYREARVVWFGKSANLRVTTANAFAVQGPSANSPLRRSVSTYLGLTTLEALASGRYRLTPDDHVLVSGWIRECGVAWVECETESDVVRLETRLLAEPDATR